MKTSQPIRLLTASSIIGLTLFGCASEVPLLISKKPDNAITIRQAQLEGERFRGDQVRWGGNIIKIDNLSNQTLVEILARQLHANGKPYGEQSDGRFIARIDGFADPEKYPKGRLLTVTGALAAGMQRKIGEYSYDYPVIDVYASHLWPKPAHYSSPPYPYPWMPWHSPWDQPPFPHRYPPYWW